MTQDMIRRDLAASPVRRLRLLANLAPGAAVVFGLLTLWLAGTGIAGLAQLLDPRAAQPAIALGLRIGLVVLGLAAPVVTGLVTYRLAVDVPRAVRGWDLALTERAEVLRRR